MGFETLQWDSTATDRRGRMLPPNYTASIPPAISDLHVDLESAVQASAAEATAEIARFDGESKGALGPFASLLLRSESAASSQIENLTASARAVLMAEVGDTSRQNATLIAANTATMQAAIRLSEHLDSKAILAMHAALLSGSHPSWAGRWRDEQVWIGGSSLSPHDAMFVPPHHDRVPGAIEDLVTFMGRTDIPPFTQTMIAHAQFETIHPFPDGNGRTGRALIHASLRNSGVTTELTVPVSAGLLADTNRYFEALSAYREGNLNPIVGLAANASFRAIDNGRRLVAELQSHQERWRENLSGTRSDAASWRTLDLLLTQPIVDARDIRTNLGVSFPVATAAIQRLAEAGVLTRANAGLRFKKWIAADVADALDNFAMRAGKRT